MELCRVFGLETKRRVVVKLSLKDLSDLGITQDHRIVEIAPALRIPKRRDKNVGRRLSIGFRK